MMATAEPVTSAADQGIASFFAVLASPIRLAVLRQLANGERCVTDLVDALQVAQPRLSNHLACPEHAGS